MSRSLPVRLLSEASVNLTIFVPLRVVAHLTKDLPKFIKREHAQRQAQYDATIGAQTSGKQRKTWLQWLTAEEGKSTDLALRKQGHSDATRAMMMNEAYQLYLQQHREKLGPPGRRPEPPVPLTENEALRIRLFQLLADADLSKQ